MGHGGRYHACQLVLFSAKISMNQTDQAAGNLRGIALDTRCGTTGKAAIDYELQVGALRIFQGMCSDSLRLMCRQDVTGTRFRQLAVKGDEFPVQAISMKAIEKELPRQGAKLGEQSLVDLPKQV